VRRAVPENRGARAGRVGLVGLADLVRCGGRVR